jgi:hypothetical protein
MKRICSGSWFGGLSIFWIIGGYGILGGIDHTVTVTLLHFVVWLGVGLAFAILGLAHGDTGGRVFGGIGLVLFLLLMVGMLFPF